MILVSRILERDKEKARVKGVTGLEKERLKVNCLERQTYSGLRV